tara:strand:+ start:40 stop:1725 length:1686 start_codon:yes stop_codon:yes gene_type:complete
MNINSLLEGASPYQNQQNEAAKLTSKWKRSGLLEGYTSETDKTNMAVLLENQAKQLVNESNTAGTGTSISTGNSEAWAGVALPLVRRVFGEIVAKDLVSVQPMNLPSGLIFYLDFQYGTAQPGFGSTNSIYAASDDLKKTELPAAGTGKGLYGAGRFGYSINDATSTAVDIAAITHAGATLSATTASSQPLTDDNAGKALLNYDQVFIDSVTITDVDELRVSTSSIPDFDPEGVRGFSVTGPASITANYNQFNSFTPGNAYVSLFVAGAAVLDGTLVVKYQKGPDNLNDRGDFEDNSVNATQGGGTANSSLEIPEINVQLRSDTVTAKTRKLKAQWTPEFAQDLNAYHSIDAEAELTSILSEYISMEIDLEILDMLIRNADTTNHWSAQIAKEVTDTGVTSDETGTGQYYTKMSWFQTLGVKLQSVSNKIHQKTLRGGANFMVVSPTVSTVLESIPGFAADSPGDSNKYAMGVQKIGSINSRYTVYKNPYMTENVILMGYKGNQFLETGAVFAPYIPLIMTPLVYDPTSFTPRKGIMTRYAKKMVRPDFYGKVVCHNLNLI